MEIQLNHSSNQESNFYLRALWATFRKHMENAHGSLCLINMVNPRRSILVSWILT